VSEMMKHPEMRSRRSENQKIDIRGGLCAASPQFRETNAGSIPV